MMEQGPGWQEREQEQVAGARGRGRGRGQGQVAGAGAGGRSRGRQREINMRPTKIIFGVLVAASLWLCAAKPIVCQSETLDIVTYTPPAGWSKTVKDGAVVYSDVNKTTNAFCLLTVYASAASAGSPQKDFTNEWNQFVVQPFKAGANPKSQTQNAEDGWQATVGVAQIQLEGGINAAAILTVFSGFGQAASILIISNSDSYTAQVDAFVEGIKFDKNKALAKTARANPNNPSANRPTNSGATAQKDPFPDKPGFSPQEPLVGPLKESITTADLSGEWSSGAGIVTSYVNSSTGNYAGTDTTIALASITINSDGTFERRTTGRTSNYTVREKSSGTVTLSDSFIILKTTAGDGKGTMVKYQFIAYMSMPDGGAIISLILVGYSLDAAGYTAEQLSNACGHAHGFITCGPSSEEWTRKPAR